MRRKGIFKAIPIFASEAEEAAFWDKADSTEFFSGKGGVHLKMPSRTSTISLRLPNTLLRRLKKLAEMKDVPYQSLLKIYLDEKIHEEIAGFKRVA